VLLPAYRKPKTSVDYLKVFLTKIFPYLTAPFFQPEFDLIELEVDRKIIETEKVKYIKVP
jgi:hypothetical protein